MKRSKQIYQKQSKPRFNGKRRWFPGRDKPPVLPRFRLSGLLFDLALAGADHAEAEQQIRAAASSPAEAAEGIRRFKINGGGN